MSDGSVPSRKPYILDVNISKHTGFAMAISEGNNFHFDFV